MTHPWRRGLVLAFAAVVLLVGLSSAANAQPSPKLAKPDYAQCVKPSESPEIFGPTNINAQSANGGMAAAFSDTGTITVLKWPRPSYHEHIKYHTNSRDEPRFGAAPNAGSFLGLAVSTADDPGLETTWLRDWDSSQRYADQEDGWSDTVVTTYGHPDLGLRVTVEDVVAPPPSADEGGPGGGDDLPTDVLARHVTVEKLPGNEVDHVRLVAFENTNLVVSKNPYFPTQGWCQEEENADTATYDPGLEAIVHEKSGRDQSTGEESRVSLGWAFAGGDDGYQVGGDAWIATGNPLADLPVVIQDAYLDAKDGSLRGNQDYQGQTTGALVKDLSFESEGPFGADDTAEATLLVAGGETPDDVEERLKAARDVGFEEIDEEKREWFRGILEDAPLPNDDAPQDVETLSRRALVTLISNVDRQNRAIVASIATQSPYGEDWVRDGAYFNVALDLLGLNDWTAEHNRFYTRIQSQPARDQPFLTFTPPGNWFMTYYADGTPAGYIPYEIDETGYGAWTLWRHYQVTGNEAYLQDVYPTIKRAADYMERCEDPRNDLQCHAWEDDNEDPDQSVVGASTVLMGLEAAADAAETVGDQEAAQRYDQRRAEIRQAIDDELWDADKGTYGPEHTGHPETAWPVCYNPTVDGRFSDHLDSMWNSISDTFDEPADNGDTSGLYESKKLLGLAKHEKPNSSRMDDVKRGLRWVASEHASNDTHVMGEVWIERNDDVKSAVSQPHTWEQILFYLASLETWTPEEAQDAQAGCGGALNELTPVTGPGFKSASAASIPDALLNP